MQKAKSILPNAIESEKYILAHLLTDRTVSPKVFAYVTSKDFFYNPTNYKIFEAIDRLRNASKDFDLVSVHQLVPELAIELGNLTLLQTSGSDIETHCQLVTEAYIKRSIITESLRLREAMLNDDIDFIDAINDFNAKQKELLTFGSKEEKHVAIAVDEMVQYSAKVNQHHPDTKGVLTGFSYFDNFSGGLQLGDLVIVAGETSNGKTTLSLNMLHNIAISGIPCAIFSYEMTIYQLTARMVSYSKKISSKDIIRGKISVAELQNISKQVGRLKTSDMYFVKPSGNSFTRLVADIVRLTQEYKLKVICIDYLQLISNTSKRSSNSAELIGEIANRLKALAVELNICIILISQLRREHGKVRPTINRLKSSGDIENAADTVMLTYLPYKFDLTSETVNGESVEIGEDGIIIIGKGRNIGTTEFRLNFVKEVPGFYNFVSAEDIPMPTELDDFANYKLEPNVDF